jgi:hypothetical protein
MVDFSKDVLLEGWIKRSGSTGEGGSGAMRLDPPYD